MNVLNDEEKLDFIIQKSKELGLTSNDYNKNTSLSAMGAHNILTGATKPRTKSLNIMFEYLMAVINSHKNHLMEPSAHYKTEDHNEIMRIAVEFTENYDKLKDVKMVKNIITIEVLQRLLKEKKKH
jgi:hypothetical protein